MLVYLKKLLLFLLITIISTLVYIFTYHQVCLNSEQKLLDNPQGRLVQVGSKNMNVYVTGQGEKTLVFLAGGGTTSPILDFKTLYSKLEQDHRIVVVERLGYGFSDDSEGDSRDIDTVLAQTRQALKSSLYGWTRSASLGCKISRRSPRHYRTGYGFAEFLH